MPRCLIPTLLLLVACTGGSDKDSTPSGDIDTGTTNADACGPGPTRLSGWTVAFARSSDEIETYRFGEGTFAREIMAGEASENTGTWVWSDAPACTLALTHAEVPPDWPETFTSTYVLAWTGMTTGTFSMTRTFEDGFTYSGTGSVTVLP
jgi:hypothetical protein